MSGGKAQGDLSIGARIAIGKKLDKKKGAIEKLAKRLMPKVKKAEIERLAGLDKNKTKKINSRITDIYKYYRKDLTGDHNVRYKR